MPGIHLLPHFYLPLPPNSSPPPTAGEARPARWRAIHLSRRSFYSILHRRTTAPPAAAIPIFLHQPPHLPDSFAGPQLLPSPSHSPPSPSSPSLFLPSPSARRAFSSSSSTAGRHSSLLHPATSFFFFPQTPPPLASSSRTPPAPFLPSAAAPSSLGARLRSYSVHCASFIHPPDSSPSGSISPPLLQPHPATNEHLPPLLHDQPPPLFPFLLPAASSSGASPSSSVRLLSFSTRLRLANLFLPPLLHADRLPPPLHR